MQDEFESWQYKKCKQNSYFSRFNTIGKALYVYFLEPYFKLIDE